MNMKTINGFNFLQGYSILSLQDRIHTLHRKLNHILKRSGDINVYSINLSQTQEAWVSF